MNRKAFALTMCTMLAAPCFCAPKAKPAEGRREAIELLAKGQALEQHQDYTGAIQLYMHSVELAPSPAGYYHLGHAYLKQGDHDSARRYLDQALQLNPGYDLAKMELMSLSGKGGATTEAAGGAEQNLTANGPVNVDALQREYQTVHSMVPPENLQAAAQLNPPSEPIRDSARRGKNGFLPPVPQLPGAGDRPGIPMAAPQPTSPGLARRAIEPSEPSMIEYQNPMKAISPEEPDPQRVANGTLAKKMDAPEPHSLTDPTERVSPQFAQSQNPPERNYIAQQGGGATAEATGGMPTASEINSAAFGAEAQQQKPSTGYGNTGKVALGTFAFHKERGDKYRASERWKDAADEYETALRQAPDDAETRTLLAEMLAKAGQVDQANAQFAKVEEMSPDDARVAYRQGNLYREQKKPDLAIGAYRKAIAENPQHKFAHNNLGVVYMEKGDYANAVIEFKRVLEIDPDYNKAMLNLGIIYDDHLANKPEALKYYQMYLEHGGERVAEVQKWIATIKEKM